MMCHYYLFALSFQIMFLQETVRNECEERFELTEALSEAKEQLLSYQRHGTLTPGGSRPASGKRVSSREGGSRSRSGGNDGLKSSLGGVPTGMPNGGNLSPSSKTFAAPASSSINLGFDSSTVQGKTQAKRGSMSDSRQRIAAAIGRK